MPASYLTELALRAAVNTSKKQGTGDGQPSEDIKNIALNRAKELIHGSSNASTIGSQFNVQAAAIGIAIQGLEIAYVAISKQVDALKNQRLAFDKERQAGIATFVVPNTVEELDFTWEEQAIKFFVELGLRANFSTYFGVQVGTLVQEDAAFYSVLPFYRMSEALGQPVASTNPLDVQRNTISLFFKSALPEAIADIDAGFQASYKFVEFFRSVFENKNYLNNKRAPRFIIMALANLLWNLQHPVDPETGFPLSWDQCIGLCRDVELFLNKLLDAEAAPFLPHLNNEENQLLSFIRKVEIHTKALRAAYAEAQLNELDIASVTNSAHQTLRILDKNVLKLIYKRRNPATSRMEPDDKAAEQLAYTISYLNELLGRNPNLISAFQLFTHHVPQRALMNRPPLTVIDMVIVFCHLNREERARLWNELEKTRIDSAMELQQTLKLFYLKFIRPIKKVSREELGAGVFDRRSEQVAILTAKRLVPLITLVVEDYRVSVDTEETKAKAKTALKEAKVLSGHAHVQQINLQAAAGNGHFQWALSPFVALDRDTEREFDKLPKFQYRMTQITELLDAVSEIVQNYRSFLQHKAFQVFLQKCLANVKKEYGFLDAQIERLDNFVGKDESISRSLQAILRPMMGDLNHSLDNFIQATSNFERVVSAPDFAHQQQNILNNKLNGIHQKFMNLFGENSGIDAFLFAPPEPVPRSPAVVLNPVSGVNANQVAALRHLTQCCYDSLSYISQMGHKGLLLTELLARLDAQPNLSSEQVERFILELVKISASYRPSWFFQAAYGETKSAKVLLKAMKDPKLNIILPISNIIFGEEVDCLHLKDSEIIHRFQVMRHSNEWQESSEEILRVMVV
jgi:hypothetical protein